MLFRRELMVCDGKNCAKHHLKNSGFSLIEIMISAFILALGLLGLAGMQSMAVKSTIEVQQRNLANSLMGEITERMQFNHSWLREAGNNYAIASLMDAELAAPACVSSNGVFSNCSGEDIKNNDLYEWKQKFTGAGVNAGANTESGLVSADACIAVEDISGENAELVEVVISWFSTIESKDAAAEQAADLLVSTCGSMDNNKHRRQVRIETYVSKSS